MKYDLHKIMKRAWELVKNLGFNRPEALKEAWAEEKIKINLVGSEKQIAWASDIINNALVTLELNIKKSSERDDLKKLLGLDSWIEIKKQVTSAIYSTKESKVFIERRWVLDPERIISVHNEMEMKKALKKINH